MNNPMQSKSYRQAVSSATREGREWLERMVKDDYVRDVVLCQRAEDGANFEIVWVVTDIFTIHCYSIPVKKGCLPSYMGDIEQYFQNHTRSMVGYRRVGFYSYQAMWIHNMKCFRRRNRI